jgi:RNA polymerase sigma factor (sigma-70 family)
MTMAKITPTVLRYLGALYGGGALDGSSDGELLERVTATDGGDRTDAELAFATLMERHGRMVWRVCRSLVPDDHDAEDAFQATFLVLIRTAGSLAVRQTLGPWLYAVANRVGMSARAASLRRRTIERAAASRMLIESDSRSTQLSSEIAEIGVLLTEELMHLPERFRAAVVLCDLEGLSYQQAATRLQVPLGTLQSRLARARKRLRIQLSGRGLGAFGLTDGHESAGVLMAGGVGRAMPPLFVEQSTCRQCVALAAEPARLHTIVSSTVQALIKKGTGSMLLSRWIAIAVLPIAATILCCGVVLNIQTNAKPRQDKNRGSDQPANLSKPVQATPTRSRSEALIIPALREQRATSGRGKALVYELDENGDRMTNPEAAVRPNRRRRVVAGDNIDDPTPKPPGDPGPAREVIADLSWVVVTGVVDHRAIKRNLAARRKVGRHAAEIVYRRVDLERQERSQAGGWSEWQTVDPEPTMRILDNLPEVDAEKTPDELRIESLVDPLPFLKAGVWSGVDVERFAPAVKKNNAGERPGMMGGLMKGGGRSPRPGSAGPPLLMSRQLDFTVEPGHAYRYRARLVVEDARWRRKEVAGAWSEPTGSVTVPSVSSEGRSIREGR